MKKPLHFFLSVMLVFAWSCEKPIESDPTLPIGVWEELIWVPVKTNDGAQGHERMTYDEMVQLGQQLEDTLVYVWSKVEFTSNTMNVTIRYGDGIPGPDHEYLDCYGSPQRTEYFAGTFSRTNENEPMITVECRFTNADFNTSPPTDPCVSRGSFTREYRWIYENADKTVLRLEYLEGGALSVSTFRKQ